MLENRPRAWVYYTAKPPLSTYPHLPEAHPRSTIGHGDLEEKSYDLRVCPGVTGIVTQPDAKCIRVTSRVGWK